MAKVKKKGFIADMINEFRKYIFSISGLVTIILGAISLWILFYPADLINDGIPVVGRVDDAMILLFAMYVAWKVRRKYSKEKYPLFG